MFAPEFNPIAFSIGPLAVHWYGLMYLLGFAFFWALGRLRAKDPWRQMTANDVEDILFYGVLGVILGGRLGFVFSTSLSGTCRIPWTSSRCGRAV